MKLARIVLLCVALLAATLAAAAPKVVHFDNGLTAVVEEDHSAPVAAVRFYVGVGSVYEGRYVGAGISHFLEHTISEGTPTRNHEQIVNRISELGNNWDSETGQDYTDYYINLPARELESGIDLISDYVFNATFPEKEVETQRGIILREMAIDDDSPDARLYELFYQTAFRMHPERYRILGYPALFNKVTRQDIVGFHAANYVPENVVVAVTGDFTTADAVKLLHKYLDKYPRGALRRETLPVEPPQAGPRRRVVEDKALSRAYCMLGFRSISVFHPDLYALDTLAYILGNGRASRLVLDLRDKRGLVDSIAVSSDTPGYDAGNFTFSFICDPDKIHAAETALYQHIARVQSEPVSNEELARAKHQKAAENILGRETTEGLARALGHDLITTGDVAFSDHYVEGINKVTAADIQRVARTYLCADTPIFVCLRPPASAKAAITKPASPVTTVRKVLPSGLTLLISEDHRLPAVHLYCAGLSGVRYETPQTTGISRLMTSMLLRGTKTRTKEQIAATLEDGGGAIGTDSGSADYRGLTATALSANLETALTVLADCLINPTFSEAELHSVKQLTLAAIKAEEDDVDQVASRLMLQTLYPVHPYGLDPLGTPQSVQRLTRADLVAFHKRTVAAGGLVLAVFGDVNAAQVETLVTRAFAGLPQGKVAPPPAIAEPPLATVKEVRRERPQQQTIIDFAFPGPRVTDADRYARLVMNAAFSGIYYPGGRLHEALRSDQLVYSTYAYAMPQIDQGYFAIYAGTAPERAEEARRKIIELVKGIQDAPISADELTRAKKICLADHDLWLQDPAQREHNQVQDELSGLGYDNYTRYAAGIEKVTLADVQEQARKCMDLSRCVTVVTAPPPEKGEKPQ